MATDYLAPLAKYIRERTPFSTGQLKGYFTKGGTYILASPAAMNDDNKDHDLMAVTAMGVVSLRITANTAAVEEILAETQKEI